MAFCEMPFSRPIIQCGFYFDQELGLFIDDMSLLYDYNLVRFLFIYFRKEGSKQPSRLQCKLMCEMLQSGARLKKKQKNKNLYRFLETTPVCNRCIIDV